jgi:hypothetical protein
MRIFVDTVCAVTMLACGIALLIHAAVSLDGWDLVTAVGASSGFAAGVHHMADDITKQLEERR